MRTSIGIRSAFRPHFCFRSGLRSGPGNSDPHTVYPSTPFQQAFFLPSTFLGLAKELSVNDPSVTSFVALSLLPMTILARAGYNISSPPHSAPDLVAANPQLLLQLILNSMLELPYVSKSWTIALQT